MHSKALYLVRRARQVFPMLLFPTPRKVLPARSWRWLGWSLIASLISAFSPVAARPAVVRVVDRGNGEFALTRDGEPYVVRGAGGSRSLELVKELGGTTIRTWSIAQLEATIDGRTVLDRCADLGLTVMAGIWVQHERHGFDYSDPVQVEQQRETVRAAVRKYRDHPALLIWGLGNEMEGPESDGRDPRIWQELEVLAKIVKEEDPNHPVCTVIAGAAAGKVTSLMQHYTSLDILGVNAYGGAGQVGHALNDVGYDKPFILAEFGPLGHWEVEKTSWGAPIEPTSRAKAANYLASHNTVMADGAGRCLGTFCFVWGQKQETTATWYGMFLPTGEKTPAVDVMAWAWTGAWPRNRSPQIERIEADFAVGRVAAESLHTVRAQAEDADGDPLVYEWQVVAESMDRKSGGDAEAVPPSFPECIVEADGARARIRMPARPGAYRLFLYVRDGQGGGSADNVPFLVQ